MSVQASDLVEETCEDLFLVCLPFLEDGYGSAFPLVGDGDYLVVVGGAGAWAVGLYVEEE